MHFRRVVFFIHIFLALFISAEAFSETIESPAAERRFLQSELTLAQTKNIYFIINLKEKKIYFKARGMVLRTIEIQKVRFWGRPDNVKLYSMTAKAAASEPRREEVEIENAEKDEKTQSPPAAPPSTTGAVDIKALELDDMPSSFRLILDDVFVISVKPVSQGKLSGLYSVAHSLNWYIAQPMLAVWYAIKSRPYGALNLVLNEKDARALYWSIHEGAGVLIYNPQGR